MHYLQKFGHMGKKHAEVYLAPRAFCQRSSRSWERHAGGVKGEFYHRKAKATKIYILFRVVNAKNAQLKEFLRHQLLKDLWISDC